MRKIILCMLISLIAVSSWAATDTSNFNPQQVKSIQSIVRNYLVKNPQVLIEVSQALKKQQAQQTEQDALSAIKANLKQLFNDKTSPVVGNPQGSVTMVEFYDYQCGHCKTAAATLEQLLATNKDLKVIFKDFPIFGGNSTLAAKATLVAYKLNPANYYQFHEALMKTKNPLTKAAILAAAVKSGYSKEAIEVGLSNKDIAIELNKNMQLARAMSLRGTPAFIFANKSLTNFEFIPGAMGLQGMQAAIVAVSKN